MDKYHGEDKDHIVAVAAFDVDESCSDLVIYIKIYIHRVLAVIVSLTIIVFACIVDLLLLLL